MKRKTSVLILSLIIGAAAALPSPAVLSVYAAEAESGIKIEQLKAPEGGLLPGGAFGVSGIIDNTDKTFTGVFGGIYAADGHTPVSYCEDSINEATYDLKTVFDNQLVFNELAPGKYYYIIYLKDKNGNTQTAVKTEFYVSNKGAFPSNIQITQHAMPADTMPLNGNFRAVGVIYSSYALMSVKVGIYNAENKTEIMSYEAEPHTAEYDLKNIPEKKLPFSTLPEGSYIYRVEATDLIGNSKAVIEKNFTVAAVAPSDIAVCGETSPTGKLRAGYGLLVKGSVYSANDLKSVTAGLYKSGRPINKHTSNFRNPRNFYDLAEMDNYLLFNKLGEGKYTYKVTATDTKGRTKTLINAPFTVINASSEVNTTPAVSGIDISSHNADVDWEKVKAAGTDFVILRAGRTNISDANYAEDPNFDKNYKAAKAAGLKVGAYIYTSAFNKTEMDYSISQLLKTLKGKSFDLPVFLDMESDPRYVPLGKELDSIADYGCELIEKGGYEAGIYASLNYFSHYIKTDRPMWLAAYPPDYTQLNYSDFCDIWQYCVTESIDGVEGEVDKSYLYINE